MKYELKFIKLIMFKSKFYYFLHTAKGYSFRYSCAIALIAFFGRTPLNSIARDLQHCS
jgi:hypothetical protein